MTPIDRIGNSFLTILLKYRISKKKGTEGKYVKKIFKTLFRIYNTSRKGVAYF